VAHSVPSKAWLPAREDPVATMPWSLRTVATMPWSLHTGHCNRGRVPKSWPEAYEEHQREVKIWQWWFILPPRRLQNQQRLLNNKFQMSQSHLRKEHKKIKINLIAGDVV